MSWHVSTEIRLSIRRNTRRQRADVSFAFSLKLTDCFIPTQLRTYSDRKHGNNNRRHNDTQLVAIPHHPCRNPSPQSANYCEPKHRPGTGTINAARSLSRIPRIHTVTNPFSQLPANFSSPPHPLPSSAFSSPSLASPTSPQYPCPKSSQTNTGVSRRPFGSSSFSP